MRKPDKTKNNVIPVCPTDARLWKKLKIDELILILPQKCKFITNNAAIALIPSKFL